MAVACRAFGMVQDFGVAEGWDDTEAGEAEPEGEDVALEGAAEADATRRRGSRTQLAERVNIRAHPLKSELPNLATCLVDTDTVHKPGMEQDMVGAAVDQAGGTGICIVQYSRDQGLDRELDRDHTVTETPKVRIEKRT
jgi:hypothetical protein